MIETIEQLRQWLEAQISGGVVDDVEALASLGDVLSSDAYQSAHDGPGRWLSWRELQVDCYKIIDALHAEIEQYCTALEIISKSPATASPAIAALALAALKSGRDAFDEARDKEPGKKVNMP